MIDFDEARQLYQAAERDWEFYDASKPFMRFASWLEDNFQQLLELASDGDN
jgi:hypothetical protein